MQPNCSPAQADGDLLSSSDGTRESLLASKLLFTILNTRLVEAARSGDAIGTQSRRDEVRAAGWPRDGGFGKWPAWWILEKRGHTLRGSHTWRSREVNGVRPNSLPEGLSPFFQSWESSEIKGFKGKSTSLDTQGVFRTTLSFPCQQTQPQSPLNESLHVQIPVLARTLQMQGAKWKKGPGLGEK